MKDFHKNYIHIGNDKIISKDDLIGLFNIQSIRKIEDNEGVFPDVFDEDEALLYEKIRTIFLFTDGFYDKSDIKPDALMHRK